ncbi:hypothetical protein QFC19_008762 [Naganishia cerealis]|uniref:Uncharacterized protein n=1 Tax=Naganishia cerealis TaxID=610337 RepID=A0ACC2UZD7_9TREE|nr:hypothetical protein QFC19_008762 [Naganishia cerealis]
MRLPLLGLVLSGLLAGTSLAVPTARNNGHHNKGDKMTTYSACQMPKPQGQQLSECPDGTLYVSQTDPQAEYGTASLA